MDSSFTPIEQMLKFRASRCEEFPFQEILLTRLCMHMQGKLLDNRNKMLKAQGINETLFMALITLESQENHSIQPSELSCALGSSRTNATRIADELEKRGWIERRESDNDRRCLHLQLTDKGREFLNEVLPPQHHCLHQLWSSLSPAEKDQLEHITRKLLTRLDQMEEDGFDRAALDGIHTPVGLSIHAETPEEIAVSIVAELIQTKNQTKKTSGYDPLLMEYLTGAKETDQPKILATIIARRGSAPRSIGTKMLVLGDGRIIGTIGGGCMESEVQHQCLRLLHEENEMTRIIHADMTVAQAEDEGMVCGGTIDVFLEKFQ